MNIEIDSDHAQLFKLSQREGFSNSLLNYTIPMFISDRSKCGVIDSGESLIHTSRHRNVEISYNAVPIINSQGQQELYFATGQAQTVFEAIIELIGEGEVELEQTGKLFIVTFRLQAVRDYLESKGRSINGKTIANCIEILKKSNVDVAITTANNERITYSGTYLQAVKKLESHIASRNGMYRAVIHPAFGENIFRGNYRFIEKTFLSNGKSSKLYASLLHIMRHRYLNASASVQENIDNFKYEFRLSDIFFAAGYKPSFTQATARRNLQELTQILIDTNIIETKANFKRKKFYDAELDFEDIKCEISPTLHWGKSQKQSNYHYKTLRDNIKLICTNSEIDESSTTPANLEDSLELPPIESYSEQR